MTSSIAMLAFRRRDAELLPNSPAIDQIYLDLYSCPTLEIYLFFVT